MNSIVLQVWERTDHTVTPPGDIIRDTAPPGWPAPRSLDFPSLSFERPVTELVEACDGDVPGPCRELVDNVGRLSVEWDRYVNGERTPDHRPIGRFWGAIRALFRAREGAMPYICRRR